MSISSTSPSYSVGISSTTPLDNSNSSTAQNATGSTATPAKSDSVNGQSSQGPTLMQTYENAKLKYADDVYQTSRDNALGDTGGASNLSKQTQDDYGIAFGDGVLAGVKPVDTNDGLEQTRQSADANGKLAAADSRGENKPAHIEK